MTDPDTIREALESFAYYRTSSAYEATAALARIEAEMQADKARIRTLEDALWEIRRTATNIGDHHVPDLLARLDAIETIAALADAEEKP